MTLPLARYKSPEVQHLERAVAAVQRGIKGSLGQKPLQELNEETDTGAEGFADSSTPLRQSTEGDAQ